MNIQKTNSISCKAGNVRTFKTVLKNGNQLQMQVGAKDFEYLISKEGRVLEGYQHHFPKGFSVIEQMDKVTKFKEYMRDGQAFMQEFMHAIFAKH